MNATSSGLNGAFGGQSSEHPSRLGQRKFTLIELLVVIAIIGILASLLLPALQSAKEKGVATLCLGNLRQCMVAANMYADDSEEWLPSREGGTASPTRPQRLWPDCLMYNEYLPSSPIITSYHYLGNVMSSKVKVDNVFSCPSLHPPETHNANHVYVNYEASTNLSYGIRYFPSDYGETYANYAISRNGIETDLPYMADSIDKDSLKQCGEIRMSNYSTNHGVINRRHNSRANVAFPDGHVKLLNRNELLQLSPIKSGRVYSYP
jgi:prepilin-type processing-associated H-X9-DG protein/prepilin-type N-terminal cleavage/methylation domain-containing protein